MFSCLDLELKGQDHKKYAKNDDLGREKYVTKRK